LIKDFGFAKHNFLYIGRFSEEKNIIHLLKAFKNLENINDWGLILVGNGPQKKDIDDYIKEFSIKNVFMPGFQHKEDIPKFLAVSDIFILPSISEPWGLVANEAMAAGLPVLVSTRCGCHPDLIKEGINGFSFDPYDDNELSELMSGVVNGKFDLKKMGSASLDIIKNYTPDKAAKVILKTIEFVSNYKKMKVLHIAASLDPERGGPTKVVTELTCALKKKGVDVSIFAPTNNIKSMRTEILNGITVKIFPTDLLSKVWPFHSPLFTAAIKKAIADFDLIHIHEIWHHPEYICHKYAKQFKKPYLITVHGVLDSFCLNYKAGKKKIYSALIQKKILREAAALHAVAEEEVKYIAEYVDNKNIFYVPNGLNVTDFENLPDKSELGNLYSQLKNKKVILFLGRIHPKKGLDILARAFSKVIQKRDDVCLLIVGPDNENHQRQIIKILDSENVLDKVVFTGTLSGAEKLAAFSGADIFVLPSRSEGFSMSVLEAMSCGLPVVITKECHFPEVEKIHAGRIIDGNVDKLSDVLIELLDNPELCRRMGKAGRQLIKDKYTWDKVADNMIGHYEEILRNYKRS
jgi:glycosyltransferase involved in cell wall biosynthesis